MRRALPSIGLAALLLLTGCSGSEDVESNEEGEELFDIQQGRFDPDEVYVFGHVGRSRSYKVVASVYEPENFAAGFPGGAQEFAIRPTDGRLVYQDGGDLKLFEPDEIAPGDGDWWQYDLRADRNDQLLDTRGCSARIMDVKGVWADPDGNIAYRCAREELKPALHYVDGDTIQLRGDSMILALGTLGRALTAGRADVGMRIEGPSSTIKVDPGPHLRSYASRSDAEGFLVVVGSGEYRGGRERLGQLIRVAYDGTIAIEGLYGAWPRGFARASDFELAADRNLFAVTTGPDDVEAGTVLRFRTAAAPAEIVVAPDLPVPIHHLRLVPGRLPVSLVDPYAALGSVH